MTTAARFSRKKPIRKSRSKKGNGSKNKTRCAPLYRGSRSCFTESALREIIAHYNAHNDPPIRADSERGMWSALKRRVKDCDDEMCWLGGLPDYVSQRLRTEHFAPIPRYAKKWRKNRDTWLTNEDIDLVMEQYERAHPEFVFFSPAPIDFADRQWSGACIVPELCMYSPVDMGDKTKAGWVFNLDRHDGPGTHWVALYADFAAKYIMFFDSGGDGAPPEIRDFIERIKADAPDLTEYVTTKEHQLEDGQCGMYVLYFIATHVTGMIDGKHATPEKVVKYFKEHRISDADMAKLRPEWFNM